MARFKVTASFTFCVEEGSRAEAVGLAGWIVSDLDVGPTIRPLALDRVVVIESVEPAS